MYKLLIMYCTQQFSRLIILHRSTINVVFIFSTQWTDQFLTESSAHIVMVLHIYYKKQRDISHESCVQLSRNATIIHRQIHHNS